MYNAHRVCINVEEVVSDAVFVDSYGRAVHTLRLSLTDRCDFRCFYCHTEDVPLLPMAEFVPYDALIRFIGLCVQYRITTIRVTGGEPFVRTGCMDFLAALASTYPGLDIRITTNGSRLLQHLDELFSVGIRRINISLDTLKPERFFAITKSDVFSAVYKSLLASIERGFTVKVNAVAMRGINDDELEDFVQLARKYPFSMRFIEYMPIGKSTVLDSRYYISAEVLKQRIERYVTLEPLAKNTQEGPANVYAIVGGKGTIGFITPRSNHFCDTCDRLRLTATGVLRTCLYDTKGYSIREALCSGEMEKVALLLQKYIERKPYGIELLNNRGENALAQVAMHSLGG